MAWLSSMLTVLFVMTICSLERTFIGLTLAAGADVAKSENNGCSAVKLVWGTKRWPNPQSFPSAAISGSHLTVCSAGASTCCTAQMEDKIIKLSRQQLEKLVVDKINLTRQSIVSRTTRYNAFCLDLINKSSTDLHGMFVKTYGTLYEQNARIFSKLFQDFRSYFTGTDLDLVDVMDRFFSTLMQQMFVLLNSQYTFDEKYLSCVVEHVDQLKPFDDVPAKLSVQVKRSFVAARTFLQGLTLGREVLQDIAKIELSDGCNKAFTKLVQCPLCRGLVHLKPCHSYCLNVMRGCLAHHSELNEAWNSYIEWMLKIAERLEGPFNIESVIDPINVKISEAIMNFQEKSQTVSDKVFQGCGQPTLMGGTRGSRGKRQASSTQRERKQEGTGSSAQRSSASGSAGGIDKLIHDVKEKLTATKDLWNVLSRNICAEVAAPAGEPVNCWNGVGKHRYNQSVVETGLANQAANPEVIVDTRRTNAVVNTAILQLKLITNKLKSAHGGHDVDWVDSTDTTEDEKSPIEESGSGGGSEDGEEFSSGSGVIDDSQKGIYFSQTEFKRFGVSVTSIVYVTERTRGPVPPIVTQRPTYRSAASSHSWHFFMNVFISVIIFIQIDGLV